MTEHRVLLVAGASGYVGRKVVELLLEMGLPNLTIIATSRTPDKLADLAKRGVVVRKCDFNEPGSIADAFRGAERLLLISVSDSEDGRRAKLHKAAIDAAVAAGVMHVVYLSCVRPSATHPVPYLRDHLVTEHDLAASTLDFTIVRQTLWFETLFHSLPAAIKASAFISAAGSGRVAFLSRDEVAQVLAAELATDRSGRSLTSLTGSTALTYAEVVNAAAKEFQKPISFMAVCREEKSQALVAAGVPTAMAEAIVQFDVAARDGWLSDVAPPHMALHRPRETLAQWLKRNHQALLAVK